MTEASTPDSVVDPFDRDRFDAILFDLDGVLTETASLHRIAWKKLFDEYLTSRSQILDEEFRPFTTDDYLRYVDGKPRFDGVRSFLESRDITLPEGSRDDAPVEETVAGLGNRKNHAFNAMLDEAGATPFPGAVAFVEHALARNMKTAVVSSSANAAAVLESAGIDDLFTARVDGVTARELELPGKPEPDMFLEAARRLETSPERSIVVEDARAGVAAGRAGGFGLVIGIGDEDAAPELFDHGADVVVADLGALVPPSSRRPEPRGGARH